MKSSFGEVYSAAANELILKLQTIELLSAQLLTGTELEPTLKCRLEAVHASSTKAVTLSRFLFGCIEHFNEFIRHSDSQPTDLAQQRQRPG